MQYWQLRYKFRHVSVQNIKIIFIKIRKEQCLWKNRRSFKVYESSVSSSSGYDYRKLWYKTVPQIRVQGKWLEELGFESGSEINIECLDGKLIITGEKL